MDGKLYAVMNVSSLKREAFPLIRCESTRFAAKFVARPLAWSAKPDGDR
jgi:hypothetical protein